MNKEQQKEQEKQRTMYSPHVQALLKAFPEVEPKDIRVVNPYLEFTCKGITCFVYYQRSFRNTIGHIMDDMDIAQLWEFVTLERMQYYFEGQNVLVLQKVIDTKDVDFLIEHNPDDWGIPKEDWTPTIKEREITDLVRCICKSTDLQPIEQDRLFYGNVKPCKIKNELGSRDLTMYVVQIKEDEQ